MLTDWARNRGRWCQMSSRCVYDSIITFHFKRTANWFVYRKWLIDSYHYWEDLLNSPNAAKAGVRQLSTYVYSNVDRSIVRASPQQRFTVELHNFWWFLFVQNHFLEEILPCYRDCTEDELQLCPGQWKYGSFFTTLLTDCRLWLPWASDK